MFSNKHRQKLYEFLLDLSAAFDTESSDLDITWIPLHWFESYLTGSSFKVSWGGEVSTAHWGSSGTGSCTPSLLHIHYITGSHHTGTWLLLPLLCWWHTALSLISTRWSNSSCTDLRLISAWMKEHHLQLNLTKTELLVFPATPTLQHDFTIQLGSSTITPSASVRNLGVVFDDQLTFKDHIAKTARSCRFALHNIREIRPFLTEHAAQLLVQALVISRLDYCNALLAGLPSNTIKPLQMIQNAAARLVFNEPMLHLSLSLCAGYRLQLASTSRHWKEIIFLFSLIFACLACTYLNKAWNWVLRAVPLSVCLFKMNHLMYSPIVSCFG